MERKLCIVMVGLPARGKSVIATKLKENLEKDDIHVQVFNNGDVRRRLLPENTSHAEFYDPNNARCMALREEIALVNIYEAKEFLRGKGQVAVLDATNSMIARRRKIECHLAEFPIFYVECINEDKDLVAASIARKTRGYEFSHLSEEEAFKSLLDRIEMFKKSYVPLDGETNFVTIDSVRNKILRERVSAVIPYYPRVRDILVSDWVKNLFLIRHGQTYFNLEYRIGGNSGLTEKGRSQARAMAAHFRDVDIPCIFTSTKKRSTQTAQPLLEEREECTVVPLSEFDEINAGICENLTYEEIKRIYPDVHEARTKDKYNYVYPNGEGYLTLKDRIYRGIKKAIFLSGKSDNIVIIGHQAVNRMILSHFLFRRTEDVPYIYIPQDKYFHIISTQTKKVFELRPFRASFV